jgi:hypothetical protein
LQFVDARTVDARHRQHAGRREFGDDLRNPKAALFRKRAGKRADVARLFRVVQLRAQRVAELFEHSVDVVVFE